MIVDWTEVADVSYGEELEYINSKWTTKEVGDFMSIVDRFIERLEDGIIAGKISKKTNIRSFTISKQTTLFFDVYESGTKIDLLLFWNNKKRPFNVKKTFEKFIKHNCFRKCQSSLKQTTPTLSLPTQSILPA